jgi:hypothetical protein
MDFNSHWDILNTIMEMKEKEEYLDKVERRARSNFKIVIKELNRTSKMCLGGMSEYIGHKKQVKNINGEWMFKKVKEDEWEPITIDMTKCEELYFYLSECYKSYKNGNHTDEEGCVADEYMINNNSLSEAEYMKRYIEYHCIYYEVKYNDLWSKQSWYLYFYYIKNDTSYRLVDIYDEMYEMNEIYQRDHRSKMKFGNRDDCLSPLRFIPRLKRGAKHYLTHRKYTYMDIEEIREYWHCEDEEFSYENMRISRYFQLGIHQPEEDPTWV